MTFARFRRGLVCALFASFLTFLILPWSVSATGESSSPDDTIDHVSTAGKTGVYLFLVNVHNDHRVAYAFLVTGTMVILGLVLAWVTEAVVRMVGLDRLR